VHEGIAGPKVHDTRLIDRADAGRVTLAVERHNELDDRLAGLALGLEVQRVDEAGHSSLP
jgi:hypothetical protein